MHSGDCLKFKLWGGWGWKIILWKIPWSRHQSSVINKQINMEPLTT